MKIPASEPLNGAAAASLSRTSTEGLSSAGFSERLLAYVIDVMPFIAACHFSFSYMAENTGWEYGSSFELKWNLLWIFGYVLYQAVFSSGGRATAGKWLLGLRVKKKDGANLSFVSAFVRGTGYFVSAAPLNLGYVLALFTPKKRALHDYLAGSRVIRLRSRSDLAAGMILGLAWGVLGLFAASWYYTNFMKLTAIEEKAFFSAKRGLERLAELEEIHKRRFGFYTNDLGKLAGLSGDVPSLQKELMRVLDADNITITTDGQRYLITGYSAGRRKLKVEIAGP
ncbi:MAG: RDD family protein [bacterium]